MDEEKYRMIILDCEQGGEEWFKARSGIPTSSCFDKVITPKTMKPSAQAQNYLYTLAGERIAGIKAETYQNEWMKRGSDMEGEARDLFQLVKDVDVKQVGLVYPDEKKRYACSPDGLLENAGLELKCPAMHTHISYLLGQCLPGDYIPQVQGSLLITGFQLWWFMSYYPGLPPFILKTTRNNSFISRLKALLDDFCEELDAVTDRLRALQ